MEDKTPIYILMIVGMVAIVAVVFMLTKPGVGTSNTDIIPDSVDSNGITANVTVDDIAPVNLSGLGRVLLGVALLGSVVYMYHKW